LKTTIIDERDKKVCKVAVANKKSLATAPRVTSAVRCIKGVENELKKS
jgi:hypothetical protein